MQQFTGLLVNLERIENTKTKRWISFCGTNQEKFCLYKRRATVPPSWGFICCHAVLASVKSVMWIHWLRLTVAPLDCQRVTTFWVSAHSSRFTKTQLLNEKASDLRILFSQKYSLICHKYTAAYHVNSHVLHFILNLWFKNLHTRVWNYVFICL